MLIPRLKTTGSQRYATAALIVGFGHALALYCFSLTGGSAGQTKLGAIDVSLVDGAGLLSAAADSNAAVRPIAPPPPPAQPDVPPTDAKREADPILDLTEALVRADVSSAPTEPDPPPPPSPVLAQASEANPALNSGGSTCRLTEILQAALQSDPTVLASMRRMPRKVRSVANAVKIWDAGWATDGELGDAAVLAPLQTAVLSTLEAESPACAGETLLGPRLIMIADGAETTLLVFGSGEWRWSDLRVDKFGFWSLIQSLKSRNVAGED